MGFVSVFFFTLQFIIEEIFFKTEIIWDINAVAELGSVVIESFESHYENPGHYSKLCVR